MFKLKIGDGSPIHRAFSKHVHRILQLCFLGTLRSISQRKSENIPWSRSIFFRIDSPNSSSLFKVTIPCEFHISRRFTLIIIYGCEIIAICSIPKCNLIIGIPHKGTTVILYVGTCR